MTYHLPGWIKVTLCHLPKKSQSCVHELRASPCSRQSPLTIGLVPSCVAKKGRGRENKKCLGSLLSLMELEPPREHLSFCLICSLSCSLQPVGWGLFAWHFTAFLSADWEKEGRQIALWPNSEPFSSPSPRECRRKWRTRGHQAAVLHTRALIRLLSVNTAQMQASDSVC